MAALAPLLGFATAPTIVGSALLAKRVLGKSKSKSEEKGNPFTGALGSVVNKVKSEDTVPLPDADNKKVLEAKKKVIAQQSAGGRNSTILSQGQGFGG